MKITLRFPTAAYAYAEVQVEGNSGAELEAKLADVQRAAGLAIQITGGGDSAGIAERLLKDELGAVRISEGQPGLSPGVPAATPPTPPWEGQQAPASFGPPQTSPGPAPFGPSAPAAPSFGPGASGGGDVFLIEVPREKMDTWKSTDRPWLQKELPRDFIAWDAAAKRNTIKKSAGEQYIGWLRANGYQLR